MKILLAMITLAGALLASSGAAAGADAGEAEAGPRPGAEFRVAAFEGQVVLVDFWASWCKPCRHSLPWLGAMQRKYADQGLQVVMINLDRDPNAAAELSATVAPGIVKFQDPEGIVAADYQLEGMPSSFLYDRSGKLISSHIGFLPAEQKAREEALAAALAQKES